MRPWSLILLFTAIVFTGTFATSGMKTDEEYTLMLIRDFPTFPDIQHSTFQSLEEENRNEYLASDRKEAEQLCASALWSDTHLDRWKALLASTRYPDIQARYAARWMSWDPYAAEFIIGFTSMTRSVNCPGSPK